MYVFHEDAGHGWLEVPRDELVELGIMEQISTYSSQNGQCVYLEEDCDMVVFIKAKCGTSEMEELEDWWAMNVKENYVDRSPIRRYKTFYVLHGERTTTILKNRAQEN